jgi:hypothetical protein
MIGPMNCIYCWSIICHSKFYSRSVCPRYKSILLDLFTFLPPCCPRYACEKGPFCIFLWLKRANPMIGPMNCINFFQTIILRSFPCDYPATAVRASPVTTLRLLCGASPVTTLRLLCELPLWLPCDCCAELLLRTNHVSYHANKNSFLVFIQS